MKIITKPSRPPEGGCVLAIGAFDGVHPGHRALLAYAKGLSAALGLPLTAFAFENMPQKGGFICTAEEKARLLGECGADIVCRADFADYRDISAESFAKEVVAGVFGARAAVCGADFRFGSGRAGDPSLLSRYVTRVATVPEFRKNGVAVSSSLVREKLRAGDIAAANTLLGREYSFCFETVRGAQLGGKLGFPTANQAFPQGMCVPRYGVYAGKCELGGVFYGCVIDIGVKPTVSDSALPGCETHIFGDPGITYGDRLRVFPQEFMRPERKFASDRELAAAVSRDIREAKAFAARKTRVITED